jgi:hypothetical protein
VILIEDPSKISKNYGKKLFEDFSKKIDADLFGKEDLNIYIFINSFLKNFPKKISKDFLSNEI